MPHNDDGQWRAADDARYETQSATAPLPEVRLFGFFIARFLRCATLANPFARLICHLQNKIPYGSSFGTSLNNWCSPAIIISSHRCAEAVEIPADLLKLRQFRNHCLCGEAKPVCAFRGRSDFYLKST